MHELLAGGNLFNDVVFPKVAKQHWQSIDISLDCWWHGPMVTKPSTFERCFLVGGRARSPESWLCLSLCTWHVSSGPGMSSSFLACRHASLSTTAGYLAPELPQNGCVGEARRTASSILCQPTQTNKERPNTSTKARSSSRKRHLQETQQQLLKRFFASNFAISRKP